MLRLALLWVVALAACGEKTDPACAEARTLYAAHQQKAVDQALPDVPAEQRAEFQAQAKLELEQSDLKFIAACKQMDGGKLLACLREIESSKDPACDELAKELNRRMAP